MDSRQYALSWKQSVSMIGDFNGRSRIILTVLVIAPEKYIYEQ